MGLHPKMLFCTLNFNHVHKQVLKTHIQTTQQTHCFFGFGELRMSCLQGINKYMTTTIPALLTAVMRSKESYWGQHFHCQGKEEQSPSEKQASSTLFSSFKCPHYNQHCAYFSMQKSGRNTCWDSIENSMAVTTTNPRKTQIHTFTVWK